VVGNRKREQMSRYRISMKKELRRRGREDDTIQNKGGEEAKKGSSRTEGADIGVVCAGVNEKYYRDRGSPADINSWSRVLVLLTFGFLSGPPKSNFMGRISASSSASSALRVGERARFLLLVAGALEAAFFPLPFPRRASGNRSLGEQFNAGEKSGCSMGSLDAGGGE